MITLSETLTIPYITKTESNNCFIIHCFEENNDKRIIAAITVYFQTLKNVHRIEKPISYFAVCKLDIAVHALDIAVGNHASCAHRVHLTLLLEIMHRAHIVCT